MRPRHRGSSAVHGTINFGTKHPYDVYYQFRDPWGREIAGRDRTIRMPGRKGFSRASGWALSLIRAIRMKTRCGFTEKNWNGWADRPASWAPAFTGRTG